MDVCPIVKRLDSSKFQEATNALLMGFSADPFQRWLMPDPTTYYRNFKLTIDSACKQSFGVDGVYGDESNYGTAVWFPPKFDVDYSETARTLNDLPKNITKEAFKVFEELIKARVNDAWYLEYLAVDPSKQGTGLGSLILKESLKVIDDLNEAAYLESSNPKNMSLYERYGFRFVKKIQVGTSPEINTMYREQKK